MKIQVIGTPYSNSINYAKQLADDLDLPFFNEPYRFSSSCEKVKEGSIILGGGIPPGQASYVAHHTATQYLQRGSFTEDNKLIFIDKRVRWQQMTTYFAATALYKKYNRYYNVNYNNEIVEVNSAQIKDFDEEIDNFNFLASKFSHKIIYDEDIVLRSMSKVFPPSIDTVEFKNRELIKKYYFNEVRNKQPRRVLFIVQSEMTWNCFRGLYNELKNQPMVEPIVVVIPQVYDTSVVQEKTWSSTDEHSVKVLTDEGIPFVNLSNIEKPEWRIKFLKKFSPEYVFIATKDDWYIKSIFGVNCKDISKIFKMIYIPYYGATTVDVDEVHTKGKGHLSYWKIVVDSPLYADLFLKEDASSADKLINIGHPKIEEVYKIRQSKGHWPLPNSEDKLKVIWAPHWSCPEFTDWGTIGARPNRMKLGTFWKNCRDFYEYAKENSDTVQFVFRPHPLLQVHSKIHGFYEKYEKFIKKWSELPNVYNEMSGLYNDTFAASDVMITEGISFLVEYPVATSKPLIMIQNEQGCEFNELGKIAQNYATAVTSFNEIKYLLDFPDKLKAGDAGPMIDYLIPHRENTSKKILGTIESMLFDEL